MASVNAFMKTPRAVNLEITNRCNLRCLYCSHFESPGDVGRDLPTAEWLRFFEELNRCAVMKVTLGGGEPFLRHDMKELIDGIVRNRMRYSILTNGTLVTDDLAAYIASTKRCNSIQVSIDGSTAAVHDSCRGKGTFQKALAGIQILRDHRLPVTVRVTIHRENVRDLENIARLLLDDLALPGFSTNSASAFGMCVKNNRVQLSVEDHMLAMDTLVRLDLKYRGRIHAQAGPLADAKLWSEMEQARQKGTGLLPGKGHLTACNCPKSEIYVRADGMIVPCTFLGHIELGHINRENLLEIWQHHPELTKLRERSLITLEEFDFCQGCGYLSYCTGNCPGMAYSLVGKVDHPSPDACFRRFLELGGRLPELLSTDIITKQVNS